MTGLTSRRLRVPHESGLAVKAIAWTVAALLVLPMIVVVGLALNESRYLTFPPDSISLSALESVVTSREWRRAFTESITVAAFAAPLATVLATAAALAIRRLRHRRLLQTMMILPMIVPTIVTALAVYPVFIDLGLVGTTTGLVFAHTTIALPFAFLTMWASVSILDPQYERAAASLGANWPRRLVRVTLPMIWPAILASLIVAAAVSFDEIVVSLFVSSPLTRTVPVVLWSYLRENLGPEVAAASLLIVVVNLTIMGGAALLGRWGVRRRMGRAGGR